MRRAIYLGVAGSLFACVLAVHASAQPAQTARLSNFKDAVERVAAAGEPENVPPAFCGRFELDCAGQSWQVRREVAANGKESKEIMVGKIADQEVVLLIRQDKDKARAELYVSNDSGGVLRGYSILDNGSPAPMATERASGGFEVEKAWWLDWLSRSHS